ncbi:hypothetical protein CICLE_v10006344mg [Citrus x clementina]|uniref:Uncharacterized protein n=1 Tax=Citrus clementina TaxID=85681 RepID=V4U6P3_CITCL|nr:hypothetical protein CICLE_v10006344mg [Citrus x clementina]
MHFISSLRVKMKTLLQKKGNKRNKTRPTSCTNEPQQITKRNTKQSAAAQVMVLFSAKTEQTREMRDKKGQRHLHNSSTLTKT